MSDYIFRVVVEALLKKGCDRMRFLFEDSEKEYRDWVGPLYVKAENKQMAFKKIEYFLSMNADEWYLDDDFVIVDDISFYQLDYRVMNERGRLCELEAGQVVSGFGM